MPICSLYLEVAQTVPEKAFFGDPFVITCNDEAGVVVRVVGHDADPLVLLLLDVVAVLKGRGERDSILIPWFCFEFKSRQGRPVAEIFNKARQSLCPIATDRGCSETKGEPNERNGPSARREGRSFCIWVTDEELVRSWFGLLSGRGKETNSRKWEAFRTSAAGRTNQDK